MEDDESRYTKNLGRNLIIGLITVYAGTVGLLSQQLAVLRRVGLVTPRKEGSLVFYAVRNDTVGELLGVAQRFLVTALSETSDLMADLRGAR